MARNNLVTETHTLRYPKGLMSPEDLVNSYPLRGFKRRWDALGLTEHDLRALEILVMIDPKRYPIMRGTGGLRKCRFSPPGWNVGKSGALRIGYAYSEMESKILWVTAYAKHDKADLEPTERKEIKKMLALAWGRT
jgi:hypothetical protein